MPTDTERREVARRLRDYVDLPDDWWQETRAEFYVEKCVFGDVNRHGEGELFARIADLIEPSCDRDALIELADEMESKALNWDVTQGDVPLVHAGYLMGYADRIREALGVNEGE